MGQLNGNAAPTRLTVQASWINDAEFIGYFVAAHRGYYAEAGIEIIHVPGHAGLVPERSLLTGEASIALAAPESVAVSVASEDVPLKIIGAQFQKSPLGIISLAERPVARPADLVGRRLAVPEMNVALVADVLRRNGVPESEVRFVPYRHDPAGLLTGEFDGFVDFVADAQFKLKTLGAVPFATLLHDHGATLFNNVVVVRADFLQTHREVLVAWLRASRRGWNDNARDPELYPALLRETWFRGNDRSLDNEIFANRIYSQLVASPDGVFAMTPGAIEANLACLGPAGIADLFDASLLAEL